MQDFLGKTIQMGDKVVYTKGIRTGSSTTRKCLFKGKVVGFTNKMVKIQCSYTDEFESIIGENDRVCPKDIVILEGGE